MSNFPASLPSFPGTVGSETANGAGGGLGLSGLLNSLEGEITAIATKMGTGASTPTSGKVLRSAGTGTSVWGAVALTTDVTGTLPVANGGTGVTSSTGTGNVVLSTSPTIVTPTIASFTNATHNHTNSAGGGQLGTAALSNASVTADKLATGAATAAVATSETTTSTSFTTLTTTTDQVTVTIGANGVALVGICSTIATSAASGQGALMGFAISGASTVAASVARAVGQINQQTVNCAVAQSGVFLVTGLTPGSTTFKANYIVLGSATGTWLNRSIAVVPL